MGIYGRVGFLEMRKLLAAFKDFVLGVKSFSALSR